MRYDGRSKRNDWVIDSLTQQVAIIPLCPEVELGLGVPRPTIQLRRLNGRVHLTRSDDTDVDLTAPMQALARRRSAEPGRLSGIVLKSRSPSFGPRGVPISDHQSRQVERNGSGLFAAEFTALQPLLPVLPVLPVLEDDHIDSALPQTTSLPTSPAHIPREHGCTQRAEPDSMTSTVQHVRYRQAWRQRIISG